MLPLKNNLTTPEKLIIGAPFGNWFQGIDYTTPTLGTYTAQYRAGPLKRLWRVLSTVRPYPAMRAWTNRLGLPNEGIDHLIRKYENGLYLHDKIISISARDNASWMYLLHSIHSRTVLDCPERKKQPLLELNVSCPNCPGEEDTSSYPLVFAKAVGLGFTVSVKLPPIGYEERAIQAIAAGVHYLHCCNTMPTPAGGMSGKPLQPLSLACCRWCVKQCEGTTIQIIGGGGITGPDDIKRYHGTGAKKYAVASALFNPWRAVISIPKLAYDLAHGRF